LPQKLTLFVHTSCTWYRPCAAAVNETMTLEVPTKLMDAVDGDEVDTSVLVMVADEQPELDRVEMDTPWAVSAAVMSKVVAADTAAKDGESDVH